MLIRKKLHMFINIIFFVTTFTKSLVFRKGNAIQAKNIFCDLPIPCFLHKSLLFYVRMACKTLSTIYTATCTQDYIVSCSYFMGNYSHPNRCFFFGAINHKKDATIRLRKRWPFMLLFRNILCGIQHGFDLRMKQINKKVQKCAV